MSHEQIIGFVVPILLGLIGMPLIQWIKKILGVEDRLALALALIVSFGVGVGALFLAGAFSGIEWSADAFFKMSALVFSAAQVAYRLLNP